MNPMLIGGLALAALVLFGSKKPAHQAKKEPGTTGPAQAPGVKTTAQGTIVDIAQTGGKLAVVAKDTWAQLQHTPVDDQAAATDGEEVDPGDDAEPPAPTPPEDEDVPAED